MNRIVLRVVVELSAVLTSLDLSRNGLDAEAGKALASALAGNAVLTSLDLSNQTDIYGGREGDR